MAETIYVFLISELVETWVPVKAEKISGNVYRIIDQEYDRTDVIWEFEPGSTVICETRKLVKGTEPVEHPVAVRPVENPAYHRPPGIIETDLEPS